LVEAELQDDSPAANKMLGDVKLPYECIIALILRGRDVIFAKNDIVLRPKDLVIAISTQNEQDNLRKTLLGDPEV